MNQEKIHKGLEVVIMQALKHNQQEYEMKANKTALFKTYQQAQKVQSVFDGMTYPNQYQFPGEDQGARIIQFTKGYAIQFGVCGDYLTAEQYNQEVKNKL
jgi:hypothetical protein